LADYELVPVTADSYTFRSDTTYYLNLSGFSVWDLTVEGGSVIKMSCGSGLLDVMNTINCATAPYRPAVFTSVDDDSIGEPIWGVSTGDPAPCGGESIYFDIEAVLHDLRFSF